MEWYRSLPLKRRKLISESYRSTRLSGAIQSSFADWLIEKFGS